MDQILVNYLVKPEHPNADNYLQLLIVISVDTEGKGAITQIA